VNGLKQEMLDIDLSGTLRPPKSVFCEIRVVEDCGVRMTEYGPVRLATGTQHYIKQSLVEDLIQSGSVQRI
jgi:GINS complex subunit 1